MDRSTGLENSIATVLTLMIIIFGIGQEAERREQDLKEHRKELSDAATRRREDLIRQHWFQLLLLLPSAIPEADVKKFSDDCKYNGENSLLRQRAETQEFQQWQAAPKGNEEFVEEVSKPFVDLVPQSDRFRRIDLFGAFESLRKDAGERQARFLDEALRSSLTDEQKRLIIMQAVVEKFAALLTFFEETKILSEGVLNEIPLFNKEIIKRFRKPAHAS
jgi:hypothetical protein